MSESQRRRGRPLDTSMSDRALVATRELLEEGGFAAATIQAVATRSGVHASAIYRRWPSRFELIEEAVFPGFNPVRVRPTGDLRRDLRRFLREYVSALSAPAARAARAGMLAHYESAERQRSRDEYLKVSARPQFQDILLAAPPGSVDPAIDPEDAFDMLLGWVLLRTTVPTVAARLRPLERTVDLLLRMLRPVDPAEAAAALAEPRRARGG